MGQRDRGQENTASDDLMEHVHKNRITDSVRQSGRCGTLDIKSCQTLVRQLWEMLLCMLQCCSAAVTVTTVANPQSTFKSDNASDHDAIGS